MYALVPGVRPVLCISAHCPYSTKGKDSFAQSLKDIDKVIKDCLGIARQVLAQTNRSFVEPLYIFGCDANAVIGKQLSSDDDRVVGPYGIGDRDDNGIALVNWLHERNLSALNTLSAPYYCDSAYTFRSWVNVCKKQVDFVFGNELLTNCRYRCKTHNTVATCSDHDCVLLEVWGAKDVKRRSGHQRVVNNFGWAPQCEKHFGAEVTEGILEASTMTEAMQRLQFTASKHTLHVRKTPKQTSTTIGVVRKLLDQYKNKQCCLAAWENHEPAAQRRLGQEVVDQQP